MFELKQLEIVYLSNELTFGNLNEFREIWAIFFYRRSFVIHSLKCACRNKSVSPANRIEYEITTKERGTKQQSHKRQETIQMRLRQLKPRITKKAKKKNRKQKGKKRQESNTNLSASTQAKTHKYRNVSDKIAVARWGKCQIFGAM